MTTSIGWESGGEMCWLAGWLAGWLARSLAQVALAQVALAQVWTVATLQVITSLRRYKLAGHVNG